MEVIIMIKQYRHNSITVITTTTTSTTILAGWAL
jgi:hypothetical protein